MTMCRIWKGPETLVRIQPQPPHSARAGGTDVNDIDVKCPVTGLVVDLEPEVLASASAVEVVCPKCENVHVWNPARMRLVAPKPPDDATASGPALIRGSSYGCAGVALVSAQEFRDVQVVRCRAGQAHER